MKFCYCSPSRVEFLQLIHHSNFQMIIKFGWPMLNIGNRQSYENYLVGKFFSLPMMNCPLMFISAVDERGESFDAPANELTDELNDGAVRGGRRGRTLVN